MSNKVALGLIIVFAILAGLVALGAGPFDKAFLASHPPKEVTEHCRLETTVEGLPKPLGQNTGSETIALRVKVVRSTCSYFLSNQVSYLTTTSKATYAAIYGDQLDFMCEAPGVNCTLVMPVSFFRQR